MKKKKKRREKDSRLQHEAKIGAFLSKKFHKRWKKTFIEEGNESFEKANWSRSADRFARTQREKLNGMLA